MKWRFPFKKSLFDRLEDLKPLVYDILNPDNREVGRAYFKFIAPRLCRLVGADYLMIGRFGKGEGILNTISFVRGEDFLPNRAYQIAVSPCLRADNKTVCSYSDRVHALFPDDSYIQGLGIKGYIGIPLYNSGGKPGGMAIALFTGKVREIKTKEELLLLFASRLSTEIEHLVAKEELEKRNVELELIQKALKDRNSKLDVSLRELQKAKEVQKEHDLLKSSFLANLSHEIRTPMNVMLGFLELLRSNGIDVTEKEEYLDIIHMNGQQLLSVMDNLIDISKLQTRMHTKKLQRVALNDVVHHLQLHYQKELSILKKPVELQLQLGLDGGVDVILTDQMALLKVLKHLMDNAVKFTKEGTITLGYTIKDAWLEFFVKDTGIGVPKGEEETIFDMFRQVTTNYKREFGGNGLGLAISAKYVEALGGTIWLDKQCKHGACFYFRLPFEKVGQVTL